MASMTEAADALRAIAELIDSGLPVPTGVHLCCGRRPTEVQVASDDLGDWLLALDVALPTWHRDRIDSSYEHADWPDDAFDDKPFALSCCRELVQEQPC